MITSAIWLPAALLAGLFQAWRTALPQRLRKELSVSGAGLVRWFACLARYPRSPANSPLAEATAPT
jgi:hypothetical protein